MGTRNKKRELITFPDHAFLHEMLSTRKEVYLRGSIWVYLRPHMGGEGQVHCEMNPSDNRTGKVEEVSGT